MRVVVVGGKLQGTEAAYLAHKAGWEVFLLDRNPEVPAAGLADAFFTLDIREETAKFARIIKKADLIIPALEDDFVLQTIKKIASKEEVPLAYDAAAYAVTSSKKKSDALFDTICIPAPRPWPECSLPVVIKPSSSSGSQGVRIVLKEHDLSLFLSSTSHAANEWIIQEYLEGPSFSIEILGLNGQFYPLQSTLIEVDSMHDCKRVTAPADLSLKEEAAFRAMAQKIGSAVNLKGIMDVEAILHDGILKVLEIDARLPSQTPTAVYHSSGINMLELLRDIYVRNNLSSNFPIQKEKSVIYEHINVSPDSFETKGEHIMGIAGRLILYKGFFGADEALTDYEAGSREWAATLIVTAENLEKAWAKRCDVIQNIRKEFKLPEHRDSKVRQFFSSKDSFVQKGEQRVR